MPRRQAWYTSTMVHLSEIGPTFVDTPGRMYVVITIHKAKLNYTLTQIAFLWNRDMSGTSMIHGDEV